MIYEGKAITVKALESGIVELKFDLKGESVNKFNRLTLNELRQAVDTIKADASVKGITANGGAARRRCGVIGSWNRGFGSTSGRKPALMKSCCRILRRCRPTSTRSTPTSK